MKHVDEFRDPELCRKLIDRISRRSTRPVKLMEFCGGHTVAIFKHGIRQLLPSNIEMLSGPGCPVCVTDTRDLDCAIDMARLPEVIITSFGDMIRVPGSSSTLRNAKAEGSDVRVVYSVQDALSIARANPDKSVIFVGIGFETTAPTVAAAIIQSDDEQIDNFFLLCLHKLCPPIMKTLLDLGEIRLDGIIAPGHVSSIIGSRPYEFLADQHNVACAVSGFEPVDILLTVSMLIDQIEERMPKVEISYRRGVKPEGNRAALELMDQVFEKSDADWRGIGTVPASGLRLRNQYRKHDASVNFPVDVRSSTEATGCICGAILRGISTPLNCKLFRRSCTPEHPIGPCMVSSEGSCSTYLLYGEESGG